AVPADEEPGAHGGREAGRDALEEDHALAGLGEVELPGGLPWHDGILGRLAPLPAAGTGRDLTGVLALRLLVVAGAQASRHRPRHAAARGPSDDRPGDEAADEPRAGAGAVFLPVFSLVPARPLAPRRGTALPLGLCPFLRLPPGWFLGRRSLWLPGR